MSAGIGDELQVIDTILVQIITDKKKNAAPAELTANLLRACPGKLSDHVRHFFAEIFGGTSESDLRDHT